MALLPPTFLHCVVAIGDHAQSGPPRYVATGFAYGHLAARAGSGDGLYQSFIVSNKHVFGSLRGDAVVLRCNPRGRGGAVEIEYPILDPAGTPLWTSHPTNEIDVAVLSIDSVHTLRERGEEVWQFKSDSDVAGRADLARSGAFEGDFVYILGFPLGFVGNRRKNVIVRSGCIARIQDLFDGDSSDFLIDASIVPGNSGGPVIIKPEITAIQGTQKRLRNYLKTRS